MGERGDESSMTRSPADQYMLISESESLFYVNLTGFLVDSDDIDTADLQGNCIDAAQTLGLADFIAHEVVDVDDGISGQGHVERTVADEHLNLFGIAYRSNGILPEPNRSHCRGNGIITDAEI